MSRNIRFRAVRFILRVEFEYTWKQAFSQLKLVAPRFGDESCLRHTFTDLSPDKTNGNWAPLATLMCVRSILT